MKTQVSSKLDLLDTFKSSTYDQWREVVTAQLKGASFEEKLVTTTREGIELQPLYRREDIANLPHLSDMPGTDSSVRQAEPAGYLKRPWWVAQTIPYKRPEQFNNVARKALASGQTAIPIQLDPATQSGIDPDHASSSEVATPGLSVALLEDWKALIKDIPLKSTPLFIESATGGLAIAAFLKATADEGGIDLKEFEGSIEMDPLGTLAKTGTLPVAIEKAYEEMATLTLWSSKAAPKLSTIGVSAKVYADAGADAAQEIAYALATATEYTRKMIDLELPKHAVLPRFRFTFSQGPHFFTEIAKLRAARLLWTRIKKAFGCKCNSAKMKIHASSGIGNKTKRDPYVNMLRSTTEALSSVLGGCDSMNIDPFDACIRDSDTFSQRIARNVQVILEQECDLMQVIDPGGGSYYIETLTDALAQKAWSLFQDIEKEGGMQQALEKSIPQQAVAKALHAQEEKLTEKEVFLVGTNLYPNKEEEPLEGYPERCQDLLKFNRERLDAMMRHRTKGISDEAKTSLETLRKAATEGGAKTELIDIMAEAFKKAATLGEITAALRPDNKNALEVVAVAPQRVAETLEKKEEQS